MFDLIAEQAFLLTAVFLLSLLVSGLIVMTGPLHRHRTAKGHAGLAIQSVHVHPTPRIGGVAVMVGLFAAAALSIGDQSALFGPVLVASVPVFAVGLMEDAGRGSSPRTRLWVAMLSGLVMVAWSGQTIRSGVGPGIDDLLDVFLFSALFTIVVTGAVCHAFNLVDGMNGLAIGLAMLASVSLAAIALGVGDYPVALMAGGIVAAVLGVFALNFPLGKLFLGDSGAYTVGFFIAWTGVLLIARNPEVSPWSVLLTVFWPFADTSAAVLRRFSRQVPISAPDKLHFHHILLRAIRANLHQHLRKDMVNPLTAIVIVFLASFPAWLGVELARDNAMAFGALAGCGLAYYGLWLAMVRYFRTGWGNLLNSVKGSAALQNEAAAFEG